MDKYIRNSAKSRYSDAIKSSRDLACRVKTRSGCSRGENRMEQILLFYIWHRL